MEKYLEYSQDTLADLSESYSKCKFNFELINIKVNISVFFVWTTSDVLEENDAWQKISEEIALKYQSKLEGIYEKWNLYIIYVSIDSTPKELKNKIENDKFSSRKIVEDNYSNNLNEDEASKLIVKHITNSDLQLILTQTQDKTQENYQPNNSKLWNLIHNSTSLNRETDLQKKIIDHIINIPNEN